MVLVKHLVKHFNFHWCVISVFLSLSKYNVIDYSLHNYRGRGSLPLSIWMKFDFNSKRINHFVLQFSWTLIFYFFISEFCAVIFKRLSHKRSENSRIGDCPKQKKILFLVFFATPCDLWLLSISFGPSWKYLDAHNSVCQFWAHWTNFRIRS